MLLHFRLIQILLQLANILILLFNLLNIHLYLILLLKNTILKFYNLRIKLCNLLLVKINVFLQVLLQLMVLSCKAEFFLVKLVYLGSEIENLVIVVNNLIIHLSLVLLVHSFDQRLEICLLFLLTFLALFQKLLKMIVLLDLFIDHGVELVSLSSSFEQEKLFFLQHVFKICNVSDVIYFINHVHQIQYFV